ncbi:MAG: hypothetical protein KDC12_12625 [Flavobacteriales bacterium]|nr:hypothetical protein [Flavobacteriales bacterium]
MDSEMIETLRLTLLVTLVILLGIILYRRMLGKMKQGEVIADYIDPGDVKKRDDGSYEIEIDFPVHEEVTISLLNPEGAVVETLFSGESTPESRTFSFNVSNSHPGKHTLLIHSARQKTTVFIG